LTPSDCAGGLRLRELYPSCHRARLEERVSLDFIDRLVAEVTKGFRGDVGVVPRQFLREFVTQLDLVDQIPKYDPSTEYGFKYSPASLSPEEQHAATGAGIEPVPEADDELVPQEDVW
jgi:hypothetical protein